jgi:L-ascorbate metabolism protein UlaG (beta-lactamase superfamily)
MGIWAAGNAGESAIEVTYLANEGVMITTEGHKVLIDAVKSKYNDIFLFVEQGEKKTIRF